MTRLGASRAARLARLVRFLRFLSWWPWRRPRPCCGTLAVAPVVYRALVCTCPPTFCSMEVSIWVRVRVRVRVSSWDVGTQYLHPKLGNYHNFFV